MFEKNTKFQIRRLLEREFTDFQSFEKTVVVSVNSGIHAVHVASSPNERNMTRKTRSRQLRIHSAFQSGYCAICHIPYNNLGDHIQTKRHLKLIGDDGNFISLKGFDDQDALLSLDGIDVIDVKNCDVSPFITRTKMPKTRTSMIKDSSLSPTINNNNNNDSGHHLRSRKNINYMTPPLEDDSSLTEKPEIKEYRELRSSSRLLAKLTDQIAATDEVWNSGRPKRSCNRQRISADERLVADNKSYYKVEVLSSKLRSGVQLQYNQPNNKRAETPLPTIRAPPQPPPPPPPPPILLQSNDKVDEKGLIVKFKKLRNSELIRLNNEAENFLFPKKDESCDETNDDDDDDDDENDIKNNDNDSEKNTDDNNEINESKLDNSSLSNDGCFDKKIKMEDDESLHSICSDGKSGKKRRRTHAEAFIMDNQKYYKFETPGSSCYRLRYQGSYLSPIGWKQKKNGDAVDNIDKQTYNEINTLAATITTTTTNTTTTTKNEQNVQLDLNTINFSFENIPKDENWYKTFRRKDTGDEKYVFVDDDNYWDPLILPYQLDYVPPLDPKTCLSTYSQIKKILLEPSSTSTSVGPSTPDPNTSNSASSIDLPYTQDEDSKISTTMTEISSTSTIDELKPVLIGKKRKKRSSTKQIINENSSKNPRKSPRQHASTLAILSSLIQQRKRKSRNEIKSKVLPTILEEEQQQQQKRHSRSPRYKRCYHRRHLHQNTHGPDDHQNQQENVDYFAIARNLDEELAAAFDEHLTVTETINDDDDDDDKSEKPIVFNNNKIDVIDLLNNYDMNRLQQQQTNRDRDYCSIASGSGGSAGVVSDRGRRCITGNRPGRKPGRKKKKNRTGWPNRSVRRIRRDHRKDDDLDDSTLDSISVNADTEDHEEICENNNTTDNISNNGQQQQQQQRLSDNKLNSEDSNKNDQSSLNDCNNVKDDRVATKLNDLNNGDDTVLTDKIDSNVNTQYETYLCVQKLDNVDNNNKTVTVVATTITTATPTDSDGGVRRSTSPKRTNRGQRRMPASPKSPRMLRRPRGRWYRER